ncbi:MAG: hypothetical protein ACI8UO_003644 [Verrucomicrobiales bacterium]|jgi:hypothetical protein
MNLLKFIALTFFFASTGSLFAEDEISLTKTDEALILKRGETPILTYHIAEVPPPEGVDPIYNRSGFIYPLNAPGGGVVTGIHPDDHYHHLGLWHAWVNSEFGDHKPDFWNLGKAKTGRVRYASTKEIRESGFTVIQEQVAYLNGVDAEPTVILEETFSIDVAFVDGANVIDYVVSQKNVADRPLVFPAYRYGGGIAYRGPHSWNKDNSDYLTSEGLDRTNSHATRARWVAMFGPAEGTGEPATVAILCHPKNHDAPQRIRTWDNGNIFFNYVPVQETSWSIEPGESVTLRYRLVIFDGKSSADSLEARWKAYAK